VTEYVLTTPALNEMACLPDLLADLEAQDHRPALWLVVDDGSTDGSYEWLVEQAGSREWLEVRRSPEAAEEYLGGHIARIKRWGLEQALAAARERGITPEVAGVLDADIRLPADHYRRLVEAFAADERLGVASSLLLSGTGVDDRPEKVGRTDLPRGGTQTFRLTCLEEIGGLPPYCGYDGAANVKARLRGWTCAVLTDVVAHHPRPTATRFGVGPGFARKGRYAWFLGHHPALVAARAAAYAASSPWASVHFVRGWLGSAVRRDERCPDPEVRRYYRHERPREYVRQWLGRL
jgi:hypothetical protein